MDFEFLSVFRLAAGSHTDPSQGLCFMEAAAWLDGQRHTSRPATVSGFVRDMAITLNDSASEMQRQRLVRYLPHVLNTDHVPTSDFTKAYERAMHKHLGLVNFSASYQPTVGGSAAAALIRELHTQYPPRVGFAEDHAGFCNAKGFEVACRVFEDVLMVKQRPPQLDRKHVKRAHQFYTQFGKNKVAKLETA